MSQDNKVIGYLSQAELLTLMRETGLISVQDTGTADGKPAIHALLKIVNAQTGAELPGGLPFSVIMYKAAAEAGYSNIAIGTVVPAAELGIELPDNFFNLSNQRFRFIRAFPLDATSFVLQMDLFVRNATGEYVKFGFGLWAAMFSQVLFELMGRGNGAANRAAEIYAQTNIADRTVDAIIGEPSAASEESTADPLPEVASPIVEEPSSATEEITAVTEEAAAAPESEAVEAVAPVVEAVEPIVEAEAAKDAAPAGKEAEDAPAAKAEETAQAPAEDTTGDAAEKKAETPPAATAEAAATAVPEDAVAA